MRDFVFLLRINICNAFDNSYKQDLVDHFLTYRKYSGANGEDVKHLGDIYYETKFKEISISVYDDEWSSGKGTFITAPATTRNQALEISKKL